MPNFSLLDTQAPERLAELFNPIRRDEQRNSLADLAVQRETRKMQLTEAQQAQRDRAELQLALQHSGGDYEKMYQFAVQANTPESMAFAGKIAPIVKAQQEKAQLEQFGSAVKSIGQPSVGSNFTQTLTQPTQGGAIPAPSYTSTPETPEQRRQKILQMMSINPTAGASVVGALDKMQPDLSKPFDPITGKPNIAVQDYERSKSKAGSTQIQLNTGVKGFTKLSELDAEKISKLGEQADQAAQALPMVDRMIRNEGNAYSGMFAPGLQGLAATADALGFATPELRDKLTSTQLFSQGADAYAASMLKALMGSNQLSNADLGMVKKIAPQLATTPEARRELMLYARQRVIEMQGEYQKARTWYDKHNASLSGFNREIAPAPVPAGTHPDFPGFSIAR